MTTYLCDDGNAEVRIVATSRAAAAQEYVDGGDWGEITETGWITVRVWLASGRGERTAHTVAIQPAEPDCAGADAHDWQSPHEVVGGCEENPGVRGHGGGVIIREVCASCGCYRETDTWAQNRETGEQGLRSVEYRSADESSLAWVRA